MHTDPMGHDILMTSPFELSNWSPPKTEVMSSSAAGALGGLLAKSKSDGPETPGLPGTWGSVGGQELRDRIEAKWGRFIMEFQD